MYIFSRRNAKQRKLPKMDLLPTVSHEFVLRRIFFLYTVGDVTALCHLKVAPAATQTVHVTHNVTSEKRARKIKKVN